MKYLIIMLVVCVLGCGLRSQDSSSDNKNNRSNPMNAERSAIITAVFKTFIAQHDGDKSGVNIYFVGGDDGGRINLGDFASPSYVLKTGKGYEIIDGIYRDKDTGKICRSVSLKIVSIDGDIAIAAVAWRQSLLGGGGISYRLKKDSGGWRIEKIVGRFAS
jgi:hypothetical protein